MNIQHKQSDSIELGNASASFPMPLRNRVFYFDFFGVLAAVPFFFYSFLRFFSVVSKLLVDIDDSARRLASSIRIDDSMFDFGFSKFLALFDRNNSELDAF